MPEHIVRSYDEELKELRSIISRMGGLAEDQLSDAMRALVERDADVAHHVQRTDKVLDALEYEAEQTTIVIFARRAPVADDLREIVATLKMSGVIERMGDYAKNIARRAHSIIEQPSVDIPAILLNMANEAGHMIRNVMDAYVKRDLGAAYAVWERDEALDNMHNAVYRQILAQMMETPETIDVQTHLIMIAKNLERIGDQATNVAEQVYYTIKGVPLIEDRPKNDQTSEQSGSVLSSVTVQRDEHQ